MARGKSARHSGVGGSDRETVEGDALIAALDALGAAVIVIDQSSRVLRSTREAALILVERDGLFVDGAGFLSGLPPVLPGACEVPRPSGRPSLSVTAVRVPGAVALVIVDPGRHAAGTAELLEARYGLTRAEARVAALVAHGRAPKDAARELGVHVSTIRTQLKSVFLKLGVERQADLVRLVLATTR